MPPGDTLRDTYGPLRDAALNGDVASAWALGRNLEVCARAASDPRFNLPDRPRWCDGMTASETADASMWMRRAEEAGHVPALMAIVNGGSTRDTPRAAEVAQRLWSDGHISVLDALSRAAKRGLLTGEPDDVLAFAYRRLYHAFMSVHRANAKSDLARYGLQMEAESLRQQLGAMTPQQSADAVRATRRLLEQNRNCCLWP